MPGAIPQHFIDELLSRADIVEIIGRRVPLKKAGREFQACCPFHNEKTPSFTVSPTKQFYHCFGCGAHGSALSFMMEYDRLSFPEAVEELATSMGLEVPREAGFAKGPDHRPLFDILERAAAYFTQQLRQHPQAAQAVEYLKGRGVSGEVAADFRLGYAPPGWNNILQALGGDDSRIRLLREAGLITEQDGKRYDRLRDRIVFPIRDTRGRVVGFGGRLLGDGKPKYLNSPETPVFHKGRELYGLFEARQADANPARLLVVEGYMDVVALAQFGISNSVATLGTATTNDHLEKLYRATPELVFCFDGDRAGRDAAWKALQTALPLMRDGRQARFLFLPDGDDPDSLVRRIGQEAMQAEIGRAMPLSEYLFDKLASQVDMESIDGRARLGELAKPLLDRLPAGMFRDMMNQALHERIGLRHTASAASAAPKQPSRARILRPQGSIPPVRRAVALLVQNPELAKLELPGGWEKLDSPGISLLQDLIAAARSQPEIRSAALVERWEDATTRKHLAKLAVLDLGVLDDAPEQFVGTLSSLAADQRRSQRENLLTKSRESPLSEEEKQRLRELYREPPASLDIDD
ncbi:MAG: DNA primase [Gammaproteobacteria bacterium]|nr:DNA primase [Gammaproteobacteria bacterium]